MKKLPKSFLSKLNSIEAKRPKTVIQHILKHGYITTEELETLYGYQHPPRAARDVRELGIPFLFLSGGECRIHRRIGILLGSCMSLCVCEDNPENPQPFISDQKNIRDNMKF